MVKQAFFPRRSGPWPAALPNQPANPASRQAQKGACGGYQRSSSRVIMLDGRAGLVLLEALVLGEQLDLTSQPTNQPSQQTRERVVLYFLSCHCA